MLVGLETHVRLWPARHLLCLGRPELSSSKTYAWGRQCGGGVGRARASQGTEAAEIKPATVSEGVTHSGA